jgi:hypothetical protein
LRYLLQAIAASPIELEDPANVMVILFIDDHRLVRFVIEIAEWRLVRPSTTLKLEGISKPAKPVQAVRPWQQSYRW